MGLYDRDYVREGPSVRLANPLGPEWRTSGAFWIIAINVGVFFLQIILERHGLDTLLYCIPQRVVEHYELWRLLTAAFCHSTTGVWHLAFNMLVVFFFGPNIERLYGRRDFIAFYLMVALAGNLVYTLLPYVAGTPAEVAVLGASGCCMALIVLCALYFPNQTVFLFFIPMPLWLLGALLVLGDLFSFLKARPGDHIAYSVHLAGAAMGVVYRYVDLRLTTLLARVKRLGFPEYRGPEPRRESGGAPRFIEDIERDRLDRILEKLHRFGRESLTEAELDFLNRMSDRYRRRP